MARWEGGFTLNDLLVVVAIIGILAAVALPQLSVHRAEGAGGHVYGSWNLRDTR